MRGQGRRWGRRLDPGEGARDQDGRSPAPSWKTTKDAARRLSALPPLPRRTSTSLTRCFTRWNGRGSCSTRRTRLKLAPRTRRSAYTRFARRTVPDGYSAAEPLGALLTGPKPVMDLTLHYGGEVANASRFAGISARSSARVPRAPRRPAALQSLQPDGHKPDQSVRICR